MTTGESGELEAYIADHRAELFELALDLLSVDTANPPGDTREIVALLEEYLSQFPVDVERFAVDPAKPNLLVTLPGASDRTLLYNGHLDTVPFDADVWSFDPLGERVDDRLYGRGATDMKEPSPRCCSRSARSPRRTSNRPSTSRSRSSATRRSAATPAPRVARGRPPRGRRLRHRRTDLRGGASLRDGRRSGSIWLTLEATGEAAHGSRPVLGENAIDRLYDAVTTLRERFGTRRLEVDHAIEPIIDESIAFYEPTMGAETARELFETPTINLGVLEGGEAINSVPGSARAEVDIRLTAGVRTPDVLSEIRDCVADCEGITVADVSWSVGTAEPVESPLVEAVSSSAEETTGERVYRRSATGGGDAKTLRNVGIPTVEFALGTDTVHAVDEYTTVEALVGNATSYACPPRTMGGRGRRDGRVWVTPRYGID